MLTASISRAAAVSCALAFVLVGCAPDPDGTPPAPSPESLERLEALRVAFSKVDWRAIYDAAYESTNMHANRGPIGITPPGERFTCFATAGTIGAAELGRLIGELQARFEALVDSGAASIARRYPVTGIPAPVVASVLLGAEQPLDTCMGFGLEVRCGDAVAHMELIATPLGGEWRIDGHLREPMRK